MDLHTTPPGRTATIGDEPPPRLLSRRHLAWESLVLLQPALRVIVGLGLGPDGLGTPGGTLDGVLGAAGALLFLVVYLLRDHPRSFGALASWGLAGVLASPILDMVLGGPVTGAALALAGGLLAAGLGYSAGRRGRDRASLAVRAGLVALSLVLASVAVGELGNVLGRRTDFTTFLEAAAALVAGQDPYAVTGGAYFYPPTFAALMTPLLAVPAVAASLIWFSLKTALMMHCLAQIFAMLDPAPLSPRQRWALAVGVLLTTATFWVTDLQYGNTNVLALALCVGTVAADLRGRAWLAGLLLALAITIKLTPVLLGVWLLARRRWRTMAMTAAGLVAWNALPLLWAGETSVAAWRGYLEFGIEAKLVDRLDQQDNQSLWALLARELPHLTIAQLRPIWLACCGALTAGATLVAWRAARRGTLLQATTAGVFLVVALLVSPGSWVVHFSMTTLALAALLRWCQEQEQTWPWAVFIAVNLVFTVSKIWRWSVHLAARNSLYCLAALALALALGWVVIRSARQQPSTQ